jgi:molybdopterin molybdotransferase
MISVEEAQQRILAALTPVPAETVSLSEALGRVLAEDVAARVTQPWAPVSAMDGYAVRAADVATVPATLTEVAAVPAGASFGGQVRPGECVRIFTGAPLPEGTDAVVLQEKAVAEGTRVTVNDSVPEGRHVRPAGLDFRVNDVLLKTGRMLTARDIGLASAMNVPWLQVRRRPRVAILATGDEIVMPGDPIGPNQIVSANSLALSALVTACGGEPINLGIARDDRESLRSLAAGATGADLLITSGGASVGEHDLVRDVLGEQGLALDFWRIAMRPGRPLMFGRISGTPLLGLPGNPVSSMVCAVLFGRPSLRALLGLPPEEAAIGRARLGRDLPANDNRQDYLRSTLTPSEGDDWPVATPFEIQDSSMMSRLAHADCLVIRPPLAPAAQRGDAVDIVRLEGGILSL